MELADLSVGIADEMQPTLPADDTEESAVTRGDKAEDGTFDDRVKRSG